MDVAEGDGEVCWGLARGVGVIVATGPDCSGVRLRGLAADGASNVWTGSEAVQAVRSPATSNAVQDIAQTVDLVMKLPRCR